MAFDEGRLIEAIRLPPARSAMQAGTRAGERVARGWGERKRWRVGHTEAARPAQPNEVCERSVKVGWAEARVSRRERSDRSARIAPDEPR